MSKTRSCPLEAAGLGLEVRAHDQTDGAAVSADWCFMPGGTVAGLFGALRLSTTGNHRSEVVQWPGCHMLDRSLLYTYSASLSRVNIGIGQGLTLAF